MALDLGSTFLQLDEVSERLDRFRDDRRQRLQRFVDEAASVDVQAAIDKTAFDRDRPFLAAQVQDRLLGGYGPEDLPSDWCVVAVDGSHIDVDRHLPVATYLVNLGGCTLTYGAEPEASFFSQPDLASEHGDLYITDPAGHVQEEPVTGALLGLVRTVRELERLASAVEECPPGLPALALVDGSLVLWGLSGQGYQPYIRQAIVQDRLLPALDRLREQSRVRPMSLSAYVSLPRSTEVINAARAALCPFDRARCRRSCGSRRSIVSPCDMANGFLDRELFEETLEPGWRSPVYRTNSSVPRESYGEHQVLFYYLNCGDEIARVEVPQWVAEDESLLALGHSLILDQCRRGQGYPVAISEAHEQAVITGRDRELFKRMVAESLERKGLPTYTSEKERSKRAPWV